MARKVKSESPIVKLVLALTIEELEYNNIQNGIEDNDELLRILLDGYLRRVNSKKVVVNEEIKKILLSINKVVQYCSLNNLPISTGIINPLSLNMFYECYTKSHNLESNEEILGLIENILTVKEPVQEIKEDLVEKKPRKQRVKKVEEVSIETETISIPEKTTKLEKELQRETKKVAKLEETVATLKKEKAELIERQRALKDLVATKKKEATTAKKETETLSKKIGRIKAEEEKQKQSLQKEITEHIQTISSLEKKVEEYSEKEIKRIEQMLETSIQKDRKEEIEEEVYKILLDGSFTEYEIIRKLSIKKYYIKHDELTEILNNLRKNYVLDSELICIPKRYHIYKPLVESGKNLRLYIGNNYKKILFISDIHYTPSNTEAERRTDQVFDYCKKEGINVIVNLGDVFEGKINLQNSEVFEEYKKNLEAFLACYPSDPSITTLILGGNHDLRFLNSGRDIIKDLANERTDIVSMGYCNASLGLGNDNIMLHHPDRVRQMSDQPRLKRRVEAEIESLYSEKGLSRDKYYMDISGHYHKCVISPERGYALVPMLSGSKTGENGALQANVLIGGSAEIQSIVFEPLVSDSKLISSGEVEYKKVLTK